MKLLLLFVLFLAVFSKSSFSGSGSIVDEENYGCQFSEGKNQCCWVNSNGCCKPPSRGQACTMVITTCCKRKEVDELTGKVTYVYTQSPGGLIYDTI